MAGIFLSHRSSSQVRVKDFVGHFLVRTCGVDPWHVFTTFQGTEVPPGSMTYPRVLGALMDAPIVVLWADQEYFKSLNCLTELGASIAARGEVYCLLSPEMSIDQIPVEFKWMAWRYAHDPDLLNDLRSSIEGSPDIDRAPHLQEADYPYWFAGVDGQAAKDLEEFQRTWPKLVEHRPVHFSTGRKNAAFGLSVWILADQRVVPIVYADRDQISVLNADPLVEYLKEKYSVPEIYALWPEEEIGVSAHMGDGGVRQHVQDELIAVGIPLPQTSPVAEYRTAKNYWTPGWFVAWADTAGT
ncbi:hypothetical protein [Arthrobacter sp. H16F315]|uniref:hypothetical protein n=1 Tax=Arthrobacter sp. H16F315 TaxID=2955314 RepID=UPI0020984B67|nr:hypothetical protein [Arthrobacter sp. H16F315]MDD1475478.1 hypothetical protein [Arthrobacter sp. H16F315]